MNDLTELNDWMDRHHVAVVRTHGTNLDGTGIGKHLQRDKFLAYLPKGHGMGDMAMTMDHSGALHMMMWHHERQSNLGDIYLRPDLDTLIYDGTDPDLGHCICDLTHASGDPLELCPRSTLKKLVAEMADSGYHASCTFELEFYLFKESFEDLRAAKYRRLTPISALQQGGGIYSIRNAFQVKPFMKELISRMEWQGIQWESWNDEAGSGQVELNLCPLSPVQMADTVVRVKQMVYEVACDLGHAATFMANLGGTFGSGMHMHHSLSDEKGDSLFFDPDSEDNRTELMRAWTAGIVDTLPAAVSFLCPTVNSYRRFKQFAGVPTTQTWGEDNKSTALRLLSTSAKATRIEHRLAAADVNPYLALAVVFAGGLIGAEQNRHLIPEYTGLAWGMPASDRDLPSTIKAAAEATKNDTLLKNKLGESLVDYWAKTREAEWLAFHTQGADAASPEPTLWEYQRYFEIV
ncbi:MAG: glutamine synthetase [Dinoroseobacter sp.]|jgi:glutamine synthetase